MKNILLIFWGCLIWNSAIAQVPFADYFRAALDNNRTSLFSSLYFAPNDNLKNALIATQLQDALDLAANVQPKDLYIPNSAALPAININGILKNRPITLVIVPGIFGEFIPNRAFEEIFSRESSAQKSFNQIVAQNANSENGSDVSFNLRDLTPEAKPINELISVASIDDSSGQPLVRIVLLTTPFASLETLVGIKTQTEVFSRRLQKYLNLTGEQELAFVGYSRGAATGLEMLSQGHRSNLPWISSVRGMVALGGVVFGSSLADDAVDPQGENGKILLALKSLVDDLKTEGSSNLSLFFENGKVWLRFFKEVAAIKGKNEATTPTLNNLFTQGSEFFNSENLQNLDIDIGSLLRLITTLFQQMGLTAPTSEYAGNVMRFKVMVRSVLTGVHELTTEARLGWWKSQTLPSKNIGYYGLAATFVDPARSTVEKEIWQSKQGFDTSADTTSLMKSYKQYQQLTNQSLNDSQVSFSQAQFLPEVIKGLNPNAEPLRTESWGLVATHHWGLALQEVYRMNDGRKNPFPREALLKAIATKIADEPREKKQ